VKANQGTLHRQPRRQALSATHLFLTSLRNTTEALLQMVRDRKRIEGWHWSGDTKLNENTNPYRGNGSSPTATLRTAALDLLGLQGFR
jgi:hypothetical protein